MATTGGCSLRVASREVYSSRSWCDAAQRDNLRDNATLQLEGCCRITGRGGTTPKAECDRPVRWESITPSRNEIGLREVLLEELRFDTICAR